MREWRRGKNTADADSRQGADVRCFEVMTNRWSHISAFQGIHLKHWGFNRTIVLQICVKTLKKP
ncbi:hypothetical protein, partial [Pseudomonas coronafaciens]|uniref:hypothetical protein n=1 Tax=Pseudomonas coronafaciens TaxID=53409 RepID=UPI001C7E9755